MAKSSIKVIYNPRAGSKRKLFSKPNSSTSLEEIKDLLSKYELKADFYPTKYKQHATELAQSADKEGYETILVAGGDGTVGEVVNGLIHSDITLGILPIGSYMNVARMLSIPTDLEKAILLIKVAKTRKIDLGKITVLNGKQLEIPYYFLESTGFGLEAQMHQYSTELEEGSFSSIFKAIKTLFEYFAYTTTITIDDKTITTRATMINVSNGPYSGPALPIAPEAKLNDHLLTVTILKMSNFDVVYYLLKLWFGFNRNKKAQIYQAKKITISNKIPRLVHADARMYGETPIELSIEPRSLQVITGFADSSELISSFKKRTYLE